MGKSSASAASSSAIQAPGGSVNNNQPNYVAWGVVALIGLGVVVWLIKRRGR